MDIRKKLEAMDKDTLINIIIELRKLRDEESKLTETRKQVIQNLVAEFKNPSALVFPIHKDGKMFCPTCKIELEVGEIENHLSGPRMVGSRGFNHYCPICGFSYYKAFEYRD